MNAMTLLGALVFWVILDLVGIYVSKAKNRPALEGFLLTLVLGPLGILIGTVLPTKEAPAPVVQATARKKYPKGHPMNYKNQKPGNDDDWPDVVTWNDWKTG
jgi:hypothetical protein